MTHPVINRFFCQDGDIVKEYSLSGKLLLTWDCRGLDLYIGCNLPNCNIHAKKEALADANISTVS